MLCFVILSLCSSPGVQSSALSLRLPIILFSIPLFPFLPCTTCTPAVALCSSWKFPPNYSVKNIAPRAVEKAWGLYRKANSTNFGVFVWLWSSLKQTFPSWVHSYHDIGYQLIKWSHAFLMSYAYPFKKSGSYTGSNTCWQSWRWICIFQDMEKKGPIFRCC